MSIGKEGGKENVGRREEGCGKNGWTERTETKGVKGKEVKAKR